MTIALTKSEMISKLQKANAASTLLVTDQAEAFIFDIIQNSNTLKKLNVQYKDQTSGNIEALEAQTRKTRKHTYTAGDVPTGNFDANKREVPYNVVKVFLDMWLSNDDVWYILRQRGQNMETALTSMMQEAFALDMQDLLFQGDTAATGGSDDEFLKILDGFVKKMKKSTKKLNLGANLPSPDDLIKLKKLIPSKYWNHPKFNFNWIISENTKLDLQRAIIARPTAWADSVIVDGELKKLSGLPVEIVSTYPDNFIALTPLSNLQPVFTRDVRYNMTSTGVECVKRDATYHIGFAYLDAVINNPECVAWMDYTEPVGSLAMTE
ncbi:phage major capsid protein [Terrisporobacter muris]|uniref:Phage major capsid protein n=1 Tax=Terrisporobacter muris TaxID=2963284 RepID=A0A9X2S0D4_9FIRM|nr:phage major capsid protein [Terrisporobacter muris]MCR1821715.1 hypothetical protein [Terrisporobacter muris]